MTKTVGCAHAGFGACFIDFGALRQADGSRVEFSSRRLVNLAERIKHIRGLDIDRTRLDTLESMNDALFAPFSNGTRSEFYFEDVLKDCDQLDVCRGDRTHRDSRLRNAKRR